MPDPTPAPRAGFEPTGHESIDELVDAYLTHHGVEVEPKDRSRIHRRIVVGPGPFAKPLRPEHERIVDDLRPTWVSIREQAARRHAAEEARRSKAEQRRALAKARRALLGEGRFTDDEIRAHVERDPESTAALGILKRWNRDVCGGRQERRLILLAGPPGVGKSFAAVHWACLQPRRAQLTTEAELVRLVGNAYSTSQASYRSLLTVERLVVDEVGLAGQDELAARVLRDLLEDRRGPPRMTVLVTNLIPAQFITRRVGEREHGRIARHLDVHVVRGPDLRRRDPSPWDQLLPEARREQP